MAKRKRDDGLDPGNIRTGDRCKKVRLTSVPPWCYPNNPAVFDAKYDTATYSFVDANGQPRGGTRGSEMQVILLPGAFNQPGTGPGGDQLEPLTGHLQAIYPQSQGKWCKGHMWNQEIGGPGETRNLVPLTTVANGAHKNHAELPIKNTLRKFLSLYTNPNSTLKIVPGFRYHVDVEDKFWNQVPGNLVPNSIFVQAIPIEFKPGTDARSGTIGNDNPDLLRHTGGDFAGMRLRQQMETLRRGIWIDQTGGVTPD